MSASSEFWPSAEVARSYVSLLLCDRYFCRAVNFNFSNLMKLVVNFSLLKND